MQNSENARFETVMQDPEDFFETPKQLLDDDHLNRAQKVAVLHNWGNELSHRLQTQAENMAKAHSLGRDEDVLQKVQQALSHLQLH